MRTAFLFWICDCLSTLKNLYIALYTVKKLLITPFYITPVTTLALWYAVFHSVSISSCIETAPERRILKLKPKPFLGRLLTRGYSSEKRHLQKSSEKGIPEGKD